MKGIESEQTLVTIMAIVIIALIIWGIIGLGGDNLTRNIIEFSNNLGRAGADVGEGGKAFVSGMIG